MDRRDQLDRKDRQDRPDNPVPMANLEHQENQENLVLPVKKVSARNTAPSTVVFFSRTVLEDKSIQCSNLYYVN